MEVARFLVEAVVLGKQSPNQLARDYPISRSWLFELLARYRREGPSALEPRPRRRARTRNQVAQAVVNAILELRAELSAAGLDAGPETIRQHLIVRFGSAPARVTVWRILTRHGLIMPEPHKRPKASFTRFQAELPNEMWQTDATEWQLADASKVEILNLIDDHSRLCLTSVAVPTVKAADAVEMFYSAATEYGLPARFLSDYAAVLSGHSRRGRVSYKHRGQPVMLLVAGDHVRAIAEDGQLLRELTLDADRDYQRSSRPTLVRHQVRQRSAST